MAKKNKHKQQPLTPREQLKRGLRKLAKNMPKKQGKPRAAALYVVTCIWLLTAVVNFLLDQPTIAAVFAGVGVLTLLFAFYADWKEERRRKKASTQQ